MSENNLNNLVPWEGGDVGIQVDFEGREHVHRSKPNVVVIQISLFDFLKEINFKEVRQNDER